MATEKTKDDRPATLRIRLSDQALSALATAADRSGRSQNAEAIALLEGALEPQDPYADQAAAFAGLFQKPVELLSQYLGDWRTDPFAFEVLRGVVSILLDRERPRGDAVPHPIEANGGDFFFAADDTPAVAAKTLSRMVVVNSPRAKPESKRRE